MKTNNASASKVYRCRVTGRTVPEREGRGRKAEYVNEDARQLAFRMGQLPALIGKVAPLMDEAHLKRLKADLWSLANLVNREMARVQRENRADNVNTGTPAASEEAKGD